MASSLHSENYKRVVAKLREARLSADFSQAEVAEKIGKPQSYVSKIERGERRLDVAELNELANIYKKDISYFVE